MVERCVLLIALAAATVFPQNNAWTKVTGSQVGNRLYPLMVYQPDLDRFIVTLGGVAENYIVQSFAVTDGRWLNDLPHDTLYGKWADSTGPARGMGLPAAFPYGSPFINRVDGYLRPLTTSYTARWGFVYNQGAYDSDDGKIYYYMTNTLFTYDTRTRLWDTISPANAGPAVPPYDFQSMLRWGSLCYDPVNREVVVFGGGSIDCPDGTPGTWTFKPETRTWTGLNLAVEPAPRAHSPMVYDPGNRCIVLFGGDHLDYLTADTWVYACSTRTWHRKDPPKSPAPRHAHALVYLPKSGKVALWGGINYNANLPAELWTYDAAADVWTLLKRFSSGEVQPVYRVPGYGINRAEGMTAADTGDRILALGDSGYPNNYTSAPCTYVLQCDPSQTDAAGTAAYGVPSDSILPVENEPFYDPAWYITGVPEPDTAASESILRNLPVATWVRMVSPKIYGGGQGRGWSTTVIAPEKDVIIKWGGGHVDWCGTDIPQYYPSTNRWLTGYRPEFPHEFNGGINCTPGPVTFNRRPFMPGHTYHAYDWDPVLGKIVFLKWKYTYFYDVDRMDWDSTRIVNPGINWQSANACITYTGHGAVLLDPASNLYTLPSQGAGWVRMTVKGALPGYYADNTGVVWDSKRDRLLVPRRIDNATRLFAFTFSDSTWNDLAPGNSAAVTSAYDGYREVVYLPAQDRMLTMITSGSGLLGYDCASNEWVSVPVSAGLSGLTSLENRSTTLMYDPKRNLVWNSVGFNLFVMRPDSSPGMAAKTAAAAAPVFSFTAGPNPFSGAIRLRVRGAASGGELRVYDMAGRTVSSFRLEKGGLDLAWKPERLPSGMYLAKIRSGKRMLTRKILYSK